MHLTFWGAILGLLLPGYVMARACRVSRGAAVAAAFPLSALLLTEIVVALSMMGVSLRFASVAVLVFVVTIGALWIRRSGDDNRDVSAAVVDDPKRNRQGLQWAGLLVGAFVALVLALLAIRTWLYPLSGFDTVFRWEALAQVMLAEHSLASYPPVSAADFAVYTYPDGIPPLVSTVYWWLYAGWGLALPQLTAISCVLQALTCCALTFLAGQSVGGRAGGLAAALALATSTLFFNGTAIGQETGFTALCCAGQLAFGLAALRTPRPGLIVLAGLFAGLGALAREYGPALAVVGVAILATDRSTRRWLWLFLLVALLTGSPWYARNWLRTGNPLYPFDLLGLGSTVNPIHAALVTAQAEFIRTQTIAPTRWGEVVASIFWGAPIPILLGAPGIYLAGRKGIGSAVSMLVVIALWIWSIPYTDGGIFYSVRVLTPAAVILSIMAAACIPRWQRLPADRRYLVAGVAALCCCWAGWQQLVFAASFPEAKHAFPGGLFVNRPFPAGPLGTLLTTAEALDQSNFPGSRVLTDDCYLAIALARYTRFRPVMAWSPEVAFAFDQSSDPAEVGRRLRGLGIEFVSTVPNHEAFWHAVPWVRAEQRHWTSLDVANTSRPIYRLP